MHRRTFWFPVGTRVVHISWQTNLTHTDAESIPYLSALMGYFQRSSQE